MKQIILVIEDEMLIAYDIKQILEKEGYEVIIGITSVDKAIRLIDEVSPILVLIDINLNHGNEGINLGRYLLALDRLPYIYVTSYTDKITIDEVKDTRPHGFIAKPFKPVDIKTCVSIVLNNYAHRKVEPKRIEGLIEDDTPFIIKETINYINEKINEKILLEDVVGLTRWKTTHYIRTFTKYIGITPYQYILRRKIEKAKVLLEETTLTSKDIAFDLGFESYSNFNTAFKKITNTTSEAYRKMSKAEK